MLLVTSQSTPRTAMEFLKVNETFSISLIVCILLISFFRKLGVIFDLYVKNALERPLDQLRMTSDRHACRILKLMNREILKSELKMSRVGFLEF